MYYVTAFLEIAVLVRLVLLWKHFSSTLHQSYISGSGSKVVPASVVVVFFFFFKCHSHFENVILVTITSLYDAVKIMKYIAKEWE